MVRHLRRWGALYILATLFVGSFLGHYVYQVLLVGDDSYHFWSAVFENWQSEWLQLFVQALLINGLGHLLYRKESEDQERMEAKLDRVLQELRESRRQIGPEVADTTIVRKEH
jgi:hypothetical protein